jgi:geranyl-CoA carboxylase beta subunit
MLAQIARVNAVVGRTVAASELSKKRFHERGQLLPRERIALLLDAGAPFLELGAGLLSRHAGPEKSIPGGGTIAGIGFVSGVRCMVTASDSGIEAGSLQPMGLDKRLRSQEIALENKLPSVQLVESAGANLMRYRVEDFIRGGTTFRNLALCQRRDCPSSP